MGQNCAEPTPAPSCVPLPRPDASGVIPSFELPEPSGDAPALVFCPPESATPEPSAPPSEEPSPPPEPTPNPDADAGTGPDANARADPYREPGGAARQPRSTPALIEAGRVTIELAGVTVSRGGRTILGPLEWTVRPGERWAVLGPNGSGKTTLLQVVSLYLWPTAGTVDVLGGRRPVDAENSAAGSATRGVPSRRRWTRRSARRNSSSAHATQHWPVVHMYDDADRVRAVALIERFGLAHVADHPFETCPAGSGGGFRSPEH